MKFKDLMEQYGEYTVPQDLIEMLEKPNPKTVWDLERGDRHCWVDITGAICTDVKWRDDEEDKLSRAMGYVFLTEEEANREVERRKVEALLLKYGGRRWFKAGKENWFIAFNRSEGLFKSFYTIKDQRQGTIYFDTEEQAQKAIEQIGEGKIIKTLFEVR